MMSTSSDRGSPGPANAARSNTLAMLAPVIHTTMNTSTIPAIRTWTRAPRSGRGSIATSMMGRKEFRLSGPSTRWKRNVFSRGVPTRSVFLNEPPGTSCLASALAASAGDREVSREKLRQGKRATSVTAGMKVRDRDGLEHHSSPRVRVWSPRLLRSALIGRASGSARHQAALPVVASGWAAR